MTQFDRRTILRGSLASWLLLLLTAFGVPGSGLVSASGTITCATPVAATPPTSTAASPAASSDLVVFPTDGGSLTVFAAASLTDVFTEIASDISVANPNVEIVFNFAGSQALATQLTEGAAADVFASASKKQMDAAAEAGVTDGPAVVFTQNRLAAIAPKSNPASIATYADIGKPGVKLVLAQEEVPVGQYARESICKAGNDSATYGEDFVDRTAANIVSEEDNVRAVLTKVQLGEADAGIVYTTDVSADIATEVIGIEIPQEVNVIAKYPIAPVKNGNAELASAFISYVLSDAGQATLQKYHFEPKP